MTLTKCVVQWPLQYVRSNDPCKLGGPTTLLKCVVQRPSYLLELGDDIGAPWLHHDTPAREGDPVVAIP